MWGIGGIVNSMGVRVRALKDRLMGERRDKRALRTCVELVLGLNKEIADLRANYEVEKEEVERIRGNEVILRARMDDLDGKPRVCGEHYLDQRLNDLESLVLKQMKWEEEVEERYTELKDEVIAEMKHFHDCHTKGSREQENMRIAYTDMLEELRKDVQRFEGLKLEEKATHIWNAIHESRKLKPEMQEILEYHKTKYEDFMGKADEIERTIPYLRDEVARLSNENRMLRADVAKCVELLPVQEPPFRGQNVTLDITPRDPRLACASSG